VRPLYVSVRLAAAVVAVTAAAGCVSVGEDSGGGSRPSHSAGQRGGEAGEGAAAVSGDAVGRVRGQADGKHGHGGKGKGGKSPSAPASSSAGAGASATTPGKRDLPPKAGEPTPTDAVSEPPHTSSAPEPPPASSPPPPASPDPTVAEPSSSAHQGTGPQLEQRAPAPAPGRPGRMRAARV
jgi:hypothetical protein